MASLASPTITEEEYLALAEASKVKLEFVDGVVRSMAGGSENHGRLQFALPRILGPQIDARGCRGYASDTRVKINDRGDYVYPDLSFACPKGEFEGTSLTNPILIIEVLSPSTAAYDRDEKLELYRSIPSVEEYLLISSEEPRVEAYRRRGDVWLYESARSLDAEFEALGGRFRLSDLYRDIEFPSRTRVVRPQE